MSKKGDSSSFLSKEKNDELNEGDNDDDDDDGDDDDDDYDGDDDDDDDRVSIESRLLVQNFHVPTG